MGMMVFGLFPTSIFAAETNEPAVIDLFNGKDLSEWTDLPELKLENKWMVAKDVTISKTNNKSFDFEVGEGIFVNGNKGKTTNLLSRFEHGDCQLHIEFCVPVESNSGIYFQGQYEIQIFDSYGKSGVQYSDCGGIYARYKDGKTYEGHAPRENASKKPGTWQSFDVVFRAPRFDEDGKKIENARFVLVKHNGVVIHEDVELNGPTRASLHEFHPEKYPERAKGPLMLQGDHGPVAYRNITIMPLD
jgi:hypothetical protein